MDELLVYWDGACEPCNPGGWATYGWIAKRDGRTVATGKGCEGHGEGMTNQVAEYAGLLAALRWLLDEGHQGTVEIRGDAQLVCRQMTGEWACRAAHLIPLHRAGLDLVNQLAAAGCVVRLRWIPREENQEADELSKEAYLEARAKVIARDGYEGRGDLVALPVALG